MHVGAVSGGALCVTVSLALGHGVSECKAIRVALAIPEGHDPAIYLRCRDKRPFEVPESVL